MCDSGLVYFLPVFEQFASFIKCYFAIEAAESIVALMNVFDVCLERVAHGAHYGQYGEFRRFIINMP